MLTAHDVYLELARLLKDNMQVDANISPNLRIKDIGLDSLQVMQVMVYMEELYKVEFLLQMQSADNLSVQGLAEIICKCASTTISH